MSKIFKDLRFSHLQLCNLGAKRVHLLLLISGSSSQQEAFSDFFNQVLDLDVKLLKLPSLLLLFLLS